MHRRLDFEVRSGFALFYQILRSQEIRVESRSRPAEDLQAEIHNTLRTLQQEQQQPDSENLFDDDKVPEAACWCCAFLEFSCKVVDY